MSNFNEAAEAKRHIGFAEMNDLDPKNLAAIGKWCCLTVTALCLSVLALRAGAQQPTEQPQAPGYHIETTPLQGAATEGVGITQLPLEVDMDLAEKFVRIGFGSQVFGQRGFQSTNFLTPPLSTTQAAQLVLVVPAYGPFKDPRFPRGSSGLRVVLCRLSSAGKVRPFCTSSFRTGRISAKGLSRITRGH